MDAELSSDQRTLTVSVPLAIRRRAGRKQEVAPEGAPAWAVTAANRQQARQGSCGAFRWRKLLEDGVYESCEELAAARIKPGASVELCWRRKLWRRFWMGRTRRSCHGAAI